MRRRNIDLISRLHERRWTASGRANRLVGGAPHDGAGRYRGRRPSERSARRARRVCTATAARRSSRTAATAAVGIDVPVRRESERTIIQRSALAPLAPAELSDRVAAPGERERERRISTRSGDRSGLPMRCRDDGCSMPRAVVPVRRKVLAARTSRWY